MSIDDRHKSYLQMADELWERAEKPHDALKEMSWANRFYSSCMRYILRKRRKLTSDNQKDRQADSTRIINRLVDLLSTSAICHICPGSVCRHSMMTYTALASKKSDHIRHPIYLNANRPRNEPHLIWNERQRRGPALKIHQTSCQWTLLHNFSNTIKLAANQPCRCYQLPLERAVRTNASPPPPLPRINHGFWQSESLSYEHISKELDLQNIGTLPAPIVKVYEMCPSPGYQLTNRPYTYLVQDPDSELAKACMYGGTGRLSQDLSGDSSGTLQAAGHCRISLSERITHDVPNPSVDNFRLTTGATQTVYTCNSSYSPRKPGDRAGVESIEGDIEMMNWVNLDMITSSSDEIMEPAWNTTVIPWHSVWHPERT